MRLSYVQCKAMIKNTFYESIISSLLFYCFPRTLMITLFLKQKILFSPIVRQLWLETKSLNTINIVLFYCNYYFKTCIWFTLIWAKITHWNYSNTSSGYLTLLLFFAKTGCDYLHLSYAMVKLYMIFWIKNFK